MTPGVGKGTDTGEVLGSAFTRTLREAQAGDEQAFTRLWRDANPALVRYLRVIGAEDPYDAACEGWIAAVRGLIGFTGDESAWRVWLLECARLRAEHGPAHQGWGATNPTDRRAFSIPSTASAASSAAASAASAAAASAATAAAAATAATRATAATMARMASWGSSDDELEIDDVLEPTPAADPEHRGLGDTIAALRALPLGQGEILVLRLLGALPVRAVCEVVGSDAEAVRRSESRALERLGADAELIAWSLDAPATPAELADERVALGAFRSIPRPPAWTVPRTRVVSVGTAPGRRPDGRTRGISNAAGRSRTALLGIATVSASVMSLGGLSAAAYVGALPAPVQQVLSEKIGAPAPGAARGDASKASPGSRAPARADDGSAAAGAKAATSTAIALCREWAADHARGTAPDSSAAFGKLVPLAQGASRVEPYCAKVSTNPVTLQPSARVTGPAGDANPTELPGGSSSPTAPPVLQGTGSATPSSGPAGAKTPDTASPTSTRSTPDPTSTNPTSTNPPSPDPTSTQPTPTTPPSDSGTGTPPPTVPDQTPPPTIDPGSSSDVTAPTG
ncbi:MAG: hypothetical protein WB473_00820 [Pedococcus sp.]